MQWTLFVLSLMGHCSFFTYQLHNYRFINKSKTWDEAQTYCRENFADLATVSNITDMKRLINSIKSQDEAWIGLHSYPGKDHRKWHWSLPGVEFNENKARWESGQPNDYGGFENCALMINNKWSDFPCTATYKCICYNETNKFKDPFYVIDYSMTWPQAQNYCRVNHTELISGLDQLKDVKSQLGSKVKSNEKLWIGLFRDTWRWSDGSISSFRYWNLSTNSWADGQNNRKCAMTVLNIEGKWSFDYCNNTKPFICYSDNVILINQNMTWVEALNYCRENHQDLVSITDPNQQRWVQEAAKNASSPYVWLGLRYSCTLDFWFWVTDNRVNYTNWAPNGNSDDCDMSAAMGKAGQNLWFKQPDNEKFNFICF